MPYQNINVFTPPRHQGLLAGVLVLGLYACSNLGGPDYQRPEVAAKDNWSLSAGGSVSPSKVIQPDWWTGFRDPYLNDLVRKAVAGNLDIKILAARIDAAGIGVEREEATNQPRLALGTSASLNTTSSGSTKSYGANLSGVSWEIDLWGKVRKGVRAQQSEFKASEADYRAGYLSLVSQAANTYFQIRQLDEQIQRQRSTIDKNQRILGIYRAQQREGIVATTKVLQQQAELSNLKTEMLELQRQRTVTENRLATLLGIPAGNYRVPQAALSKTVRPLDVPPGLPSDLLARRPDILAAEYRVLKAYELVGQARLAKLPSIKLTGTGGLASALLTGLLSGWTLGLGAAVNIPIFDPTLDLQIEGNEVSHRIAEDQYRKTVIKAFEEVENALVNLASRKAQRRELQRRIGELRVVNSAVYAQLREGMVSQLEVFESERSLLSARQALLAIDHQILQDTVTLYKALGGGWPKEQVRLTAR